jgi:hypothetical protein
LDSYYVDPPQSYTPEPTHSPRNEVATDSLVLDNSALSDASSEPSPTIIKRRNLGPRQGRVSFLASLSEKLEKRYALVAARDTPPPRVRDTPSDLEGAPLSSEITHHLRHAIKGSDESSLTLEAITVSDSDYQGPTFYSSANVGDGSDEAYDLSSLLDDDTFVRLPAVGPSHLPEAQFRSSKRGHRMSDVSTVRESHSHTSSPRQHQSKEPFDDLYAQLNFSEVRDDEEDLTLRPTGPNLTAPDIDLTWNPGAESTKIYSEIVQRSSPPDVHVGVPLQEGNASAKFPQESPIVEKPLAKKSKLRKLSLLTPPSEGPLSNQLSSPVSNLIS